MYKKYLLSLMATATLCCTHVAAISPLEIINSASPSCMDWVYLGNYYGCNLVNHWIPVAYVEVTSKSGVTFVDGNIPPLPINTGIGSAPLGASLSGQSGPPQQSYMDNASQAGALLVSNHLWKMSAAAISRYGRTCSVSDAYAPLSPAEILAIQLYSQVNAQCPIPQPAGYFNGDVTQSLMRGYTTSGDRQAWMTGCRDQPASQAIMSGAMKCEFGINVGNPLQSDACLGTWGSLYPRQTRERGLTQVDASAKTAVRALSMGRTTGTIPFPVDVFMRFNQVQPQVSQCQQVGLPSVPGFSNLKVATDGNYGMIFWRNVTCCGQ
jgi:hypothetical protein